MDLIELPPPDGPYRPAFDPNGPPAGRIRFRALWVALALVILLGVAIVNRQRTSGVGNGSAKPIPTSQVGLPSPLPSSGSNGGSGGTGSGRPPSVACPLIRDVQSHLAYRCIDNYLVEDGSDTFLGLRIALNHEVEPGWVISEGSGDPTSIVEPPNDTVLGGSASPAALRLPLRVSPLASASVSASPAAVRSEVERRTELAMQKAYGDNPSVRTLSAAPRTLGGVVGFEQVSEITINPAFRLAQGLAVRTERLWVVGLPSPTGVSIFMLSIPDERKDLWPKAEATVGTVHII